VDLNEGFVQNMNKVLKHEYECISLKVLVMSKLNVKHNFILKVLKSKLKTLTNSRKIMLCLQLIVVGNSYR